MQSLFPQYLNVKVIRRRIVTSETRNDDEDKLPTGYEKKKIPLNNLIWIKPCMHVQSFIYLIFKFVYCLQQITKM